MKRESIFKFTILILSMLIVVLAHAQPRIENTNLQIVNDKLEITYTLINCNANEKVSIWLEVTGKGGNSIEASSVTGDIGNNMECGNSKKIIWDFVADNIRENTDVDIVVKGAVVIKEQRSESVDRGKPKHTKGKAILVSALLPGAGLSLTQNGKPWWLLSIPYAACFGAAIAYNSSAVANYDSYLKEENIDKRKNLATKWSDQVALQYAFGVLAGGIWGLNMILTLAIPNHSYPSTAFIPKKSGFSVAMDYNMKANAPLLSLKYKF